MNKKTILPYKLIKINKIWKILIIILSIKIKFLSLQNYLIGYVSLFNFKIK